MKSRDALLPPFVQATYDELAPIFTENAAANVPESPVNYPVKRYVILMTPRSGSTVLSAALAKTGVLGRPGERFNRASGYVQELARKTGARDLAGLIDQVVNTSLTPNGVSGIKGGLHQVLPYMMTRHWRDQNADTLYLYLTREDVLRQAVSRYKGMETKIWHFRGEETRESRKELLEVPYDFDAIQKQVHYIVEMMCDYEMYFARLGILPYRLTYEQVTSQMPEIVAEIARRLDVTLDREITLEEAGMEKLADENSEALIEQFKCDIRRRLDAQ
jgi:LPS sulfotransferase NodH